jgi:pimeloyl-ACP methyl ester carboxylesterase/DNA-binding CsgD family transcriptional regulator
MTPHTPQDIRFCTSRDGTRIAYAVCGKGPMLFWGQHWVHQLDRDWDDPIWRPWLELLTRHHSVIRFDWRGCGLSDRENVEFSFQRYVEDFEAVVEAAQLDRFVLFGMSNGAHVGAAFAARHPKRVSRLILLSCQAEGRLTDQPTQKQVDEVEARVKLIALAWEQEHAAYKQFSASLHIPDASDTQRLAHTDLLRQTTSPANVVDLIHAIAHTDLRDVLPRIRCPTLVMHARGDSIILFDEGRRAAALIPGARFVPLESTNHILLDNEPAWRKFSAELEAFIAMPEQPSYEFSLADLTLREREVLEAVAQGVDNHDIAARLAVSEKTIRNHVSAIFSKLGVKSRAQAVARARDAGLGRKL